jgi:hypothetical protein
VLCGFVLTGTPTWTVVSAIPAQADPLTPAEVTFLRDVHDNAADVGETEAQLLSDGWYACHNRDIGVSTTAMGVSPVVAQWALADLCPNGCPQGCWPQHPSQ